MSIKLFLINFFRMKIYTKVLFRNLLQIWTLAGNHNTFFGRISNYTTQRKCVACNQTLGRLRYFFFFFFGQHSIRYCAVCTEIVSIQIDIASANLRKQFCVVKHCGKIAPFCLSENKKKRILKCFLSKHIKSQENCISVCIYMCVRPT